MTTEQFIAWLESQYPRAIIEKIDDERLVMIDRLMFHCTIKWGLIGDVVNGYEDRWCFSPDLSHVKACFEEWKGRGFEGEPNGWRRHPSTGRRRNDVGDPASEYINW